MGRKAINSQNTGTTIKSASVLDTDEWKKEEEEEEEKEKKEDNAHKGR